MEEDSDDSYPDEYCYYNDDDDDDDDDICGFWDKFSTAAKYSGIHPALLYSQDHHFHSVNFISREQADKNAEELIEEEKKEKEKADRKRLKKKRQKDRKRQQRLKEVEKPAEENLAPVDAGGKDGARAADPAQDDIGELSNEDDLDLRSTFVRQAQKKMENKPKPERKERSKENLRERERDRSHDSMCEKTEEKMAACPPAAQRNGHSVDKYIVQESMDLAGIGNNLASRGSYLEALHYYTEAIRLNPEEYRFLGNRSYSYERVGRYREALQDAEKSLELQPHFMKGHFRKGKALKGLKRYSEAITAFQRVLSCDVNRQEAAREVADCRQKLQELTMSMRVNLPSFTPLLQLMPPGPLGHNINKKVFVPHNRVYTRCDGGQAAPHILPAAKPVSSTLYPVWVGNITGRITEEVLRSQFAVFGAIHSLRILYSRTCAFINFTDKHAAESAFRALQGLNIEGTTFVLQLRNPEHSNLNPGGSGARK